MGEGRAGCSRDHPKPAWQEEGQGACCEGAGGSEPTCNLAPQPVLNPCLEHVLTPITHHPHARTPHGDPQEQGTGNREKKAVHGAVPCSVTLIRTSPETLLEEQNVRGAVPPGGLGLAGLVLWFPRLR